MQMVPMEDVKGETKVKVAEFLLLQLQPLLSAGNLNIGRSDFSKSTDIPSVEKPLKDYENLDEVLGKVNVEMTDSFSKGN